MNNEKTNPNFLSPKFLRRRKMLLALPLLVLPFVILGFWALGGGSGNASQATTPSGLNPHLPNAQLKDDPSATKLSFYQQADQDSFRLNQQIKDDPFLRFREPKDTQLHFAQKYSGDPSSADYRDPNEQRVYQKLAELNQQLNVPPVKSNSSGPKFSAAGSPKEDVERLDRLMLNMNKDSITADPEIDQLNGMMEKILDIQHPERVGDKLKQNSVEHKQEVFPVTAQDHPGDISLFQNDTISNDNTDTLQKLNSHNEFYSLDDNNESGNATQNAIEAVIHETQTVVSGATMKLRLLSDVYIAGRLIPKNNLVFGTASLDGERLNIDIRGIRCQNSLLPVALSIYDMDGLEGIYIPGAISRDVAKQSTDNALQNIGLSTVDPSLKMQVASSGIEAAKSLISKKVKLIKVTVKAGYQVLLKDNNNKQ